MESYGPDSSFDLTPVVEFGTPRCQDLYEIIRDMGVGHKVIYFSNYQGIHRLGFPSRDQALMFKLRF